MHGSDGPGSDSGAPTGGSGGPGGGSGGPQGLISWDDYNGRPMLELWTARFRNLQGRQGRA